MEGNKQEGGGVAAKALFDYPLLISKVEEHKRHIEQNAYMAGLVRRKKKPFGADFLHFLLIIGWKQMINHLI